MSSTQASRRAFITGGAGALGKAFAKNLSEQGWTLAMADINEEALRRAKEEIKATTCYTYAFDVSDRGAFKSAFDDFISKEGGIDLMINNAGVGDGGVFGEYELEKWEWITGINQMAVVYGSHYAAQVMKQQRSGTILTVSSIAGVACMPNMSMYNVTKAAALALGESIYAELKPWNVHVAVALPEFFKSGIMQFAKGDENATTIGKKKIEKAPISPDEVADFILKKAEEKKFYILHPMKARLAFRARNFFPNYFLKMKFKEFVKKKWVQERLEQK